MECGASLEINNPRPAHEPGTPRGYSVKQHTFITVRLTDPLATALAEHKARTHEPTSSFVRRALEDALQPGIDGLDHDDLLKRHLARLEKRNHELPS